MGSTVPTGAPHLCSSTQSSIVTKENGGPNSLEEQQ